MTAPMFKVFTGAMQPYTASVGGVERKFIKTTASSTVADRKGHEFDVKALQKMGTAAQGMTIFLNHEYRVPEDLFGTVTKAATNHNGFDSEKNAVWDLDLDVMVNESNPRAIQAWEAYESGVRMGVSVGVIVKEWQDSKKNPDIQRIMDVDFLEASIVGIPANPRTWVQGAVKSINNFIENKQSGLLETLDLLDAIEVKSVDPEEQYAMCGADTSGGACKKPSGHDGDHSSAYQKAAEPPQAPDDDTPKKEEGESTEPIDPDNDDSLSGQEVAKSVTDDEKTDVAEELEKSSDPEASASEATLSASESESEPGSMALSLGIDYIVETYKARVQTLTDQIAVLTQERNEAREVGRLALEYVERIRSTPLGRKATFARQITSFKRDLSGVYGEDFLAFLERENK